MEDKSPLSQNDIKLKIPRPEDQTIQKAHLLLEQVRLENKPSDVFIALIHLAQLHFRQGHYDQVRILVSEVLRDAPQNTSIYCDALCILGNCAAELGDPDAAESNYHQSIDLARQLGYRYGLYKGLHSLATNIYWPRGQFDLTLAAGKEALSQAQALHLGEELWFPLSDIAWVYWSTGQRDLAGKIADQMEQVVSPGSLGDGFTCCLRAGLVEPAPGYLDMVLPLYQRARSIAEATGDPGLNVEVRLGLCQCYRADGNLAAAAAWADDAVAISMRMDYRQFQAIALIEQGRTALAAGNHAGALADLEAASEIATGLQASFDLTRISLIRAALLFICKDPQAAAVWDQTAGLVRKYGYEFLLEKERALVMPLIAMGLDSHDPRLARVSRELYDQILHVTPAPLKVGMLGGFSVQVGARSVSREMLRQRRAGELLALLLSNESCSLMLSQVTEAMCPEKSPEAALDFYHHAISSLRRMLEPDLPDRRFACRYLNVDEERIKLILPRGSEVDLQEFEAAIRAKDWEKAVELYHGEFLSAFRDIEWTIPLRQHLADRFEFALLALAETRLKEDHPAVCLELCRRLLLNNPWQEQAVGLGMRAAMALNDRMTAIKLYLRLEKVLEKELGIAPQKDLQLLYADLRRRSLK